ncbi:hypothetical protein MSGX11T_03427 [Mycoplasma synoviae GX11-T]|nr:hypothetical protein [Mycoplasmopsis synoviae]MBD5789041.1 hypothetical protein [Mycoplasmopsis synoviae GX11-T]
MRFKTSFKSLAKYLIIKNNYVRAKDKQWEAMTFLSLKDEYSHYVCQGHSEFIYMSLKLLGFEKVGFEDRYFYRENKQYVNHVNNIYDLDGKRYVIVLLLQINIIQVMKIYLN